MDIDILLRESTEIIVQSIFCMYFESILETKSWQIYYACINIAMANNFALGSDSHIFIFQPYYYIKIKCFTSVSGFGLELFLIM
jgi:hypothetical protein